MLGSMLFIIVLSMVAMVIQAGVQVPDNCVMDITAFKANVPGNDWVTLYAIDDNQSIFGRNLKKHNLYHFLGDGTTLVTDIFRWSEPDLKCRYSTLELPMTPFGISLERAEFYGSGTTVVRYVSSNPAKYFITNVCIDGPLCTKSVNSVKIIDQRTDASCLSTGSSDIVLDNVPWDEINDDLKNCYGREFGDNQSPPLSWVWKGRTECPPPS